jgi:hypothetical protein
MGLLPPPVVRLKRALHVDARKSSNAKEKGMVGKAGDPVKRGRKRRSKKILGR